MKIQDHGMTQENKQTAEVLRKKGVMVTQGHTIANKVMIERMTQEVMMTHPDNMVQGNKMMLGIIIGHIITPWNNAKTQT